MRPRRGVAAPGLGSVGHRVDQLDAAAVRGNATFLKLPGLLETLEAVPDSRHVRVDLTGVRHLDQACGQAIDQWAAHRGGVELIHPVSD